MGRVIYAILTNESRVDKLYLLASKEIYTDFSSSWDSAKNLTRTLDYYKNLGVTTINSSGAGKKNGTYDSYWWLRTATAITGSYFYDVSNNGDWSNYDANYTGGAAPAFRIG